MATEPAVSIRGVAKTFALHKKHRAASGLDSNRIAALGTLFRQVIKSNAAIPEKSGRTLVALSGIDLDVMPGEVLGIIGRNGAGKSTLLKILARVIDPSAGSVRMRGRIASLIELGIGFMPELSLRENIQLYARLAGLSVKNADEAEGRILEFAELSEYRDWTLRECPSGSFIRLAFSTLVNLEADVILADEVLAVGDHHYRQICEKRIRGAAQTGEAVLFVSHDMNAVRRICSRVMWIDHGKIRMIGETAKIVAAYESELLAGRLLEPGDPDSSCRIVEFGLLSEQRTPIGALQLDRPAYLDCMFRIFHAGVTIEVVIELWQGQNCVFSARSPKHFRDTESTFRASLCIPPDFLNECSYEARCKLVVRQPMGGDADAYPADMSELQFQVFNTNPSQSVWSDWQWGRGGLIAPRLEWRQITSAESKPHARLLPGAAE
jgi:homopolymeric O-antigen transport system ATP-binding protein